MTEVVAAFAGTGKSHLGADPNFLDLDSRGYSWINYELGVRNPDFPHNYIADIQSHLGQAAYILVSSSTVVRTALTESTIPFTLVYPARGLRDEYVQRMVARGSSSDFVTNIANTWDNLIDGLERQNCSKKIVLQSGQYLSDVLPPSKLLTPQI